MNKTDPLTEALTEASGGTVRELGPDDTFDEGEAQVEIAVTERTASLPPDIMAALAMGGVHSPGKHSKGKQAPKGVATPDHRKVRRRAAKAKAQHKTPRAKKVKRGH